MRSVIAALLLLVLNAASAAAQAAQDANREGEALYVARCATCHDRGVARAASREALNRLAPELIRQALTTGSMREHGAGLTAAQIDSWPGGSAAPRRLELPTTRVPPTQRRLVIRAVRCAGTGGESAPRSIAFNPLRWRA